jgi:predicted kinase
LDGGNDFIMKKTIIIMRGLPGCGKSTLSEKIKEKYPFFKIISKDDFRFLEEKYVFNDENEKTVEIKFKEELKKSLLNSESLIIDNTNISADKTQKIINDFKDYFSIEIFFNNEDFTALAKNNKHKVSKEDIIKLSKHLETNISCDEKINVFDYKTDVVLKKLQYFYKSNKKTETKKRTKPEAEQIFLEVLELHVNGYTRKQIVQYCSETHKISDRQTDNYLAKVYDEISNNSAEYKEKLIKQSIRRFNDLYDKNSAIQDYRECRAVQESIIKLFGLSAPDKIDHTTKGESLNIPILNINPLDDIEEDDTADDSFKKNCNT